MRRICPRSAGDAPQHLPQHRAQTLFGQGHVAALHALVDALHELGHTLGIGYQGLDPTGTQGQVVQPRLVSARRGQHDGLARPQGLHMARGLLRNVQDVQLRKQRLQLGMPDMGRVAGHGR